MTTPTQTPLSTTMTNPSSEAPENVVPDVVSDADFELELFEQAVFERFEQLQDFLKENTLSLCYLQHFTIRDYLDLHSRVVYEQCWQGYCECGNKVTTHYESLDPNCFTTFKQWFYAHCSSLKKLYKFFNDIMPYNHFVWMVWRKSDANCRSLCGLEN
jgi:hypothetical protein